MIYLVCLLDKDYGTTKIQGAFARQADAVSYGVWMMTSGKVEIHQSVEITQLAVAPPGAMGPAMLPEAEA